MNRLYISLSRVPLHVRRASIHLLGVAGLVLALPALAQYRSYPLPPLGNDVVGQLLQYPAQQEDTLLDIARRFSLGQDEIIQDNPQVDKWLPGKGTPVLLSTQFILPRGARQGIILNVPEMRLYYFPPASKGLGQQVITYPVSIGRMDWNTPIGMTRVVRKDKDPAWYPPASIKKEHAEKGDILPDVVPAGPDNPLGQHAMRLGKSNVVTRALGVDAAVDVSLGEHDVRGGDLFLLCSDGLHDSLSEEDILANLRRFMPDLPRLTRALIQAANARGGKDNISVIVGHALSAPEATPEPAWWRRIMRRST